jgi:predicted site-specific integrase-resolvase
LEDKTQTVGDISPSTWYTARTASAFLDVTEETVKKYFKNGTLKGEQKGPKRQWHVRGSEIIRLLKEWKI